MYARLTLFSEHKWGESVCMQFLMVVISKMAHKVDLGSAKRQISQSLNSKMLHQEYAERSLERKRRWGLGSPEYTVCIYTVVSRRC